MSSGPKHAIPFLKVPVNVLETHFARGYHLKNNNVI